MFKDITFGQYYQTESRIHSLDPRTKLTGTFWFIVSLFVADRLLCFIPAVLFLAIVIKLSRVPLKFMLKGLSSLVFIMLLTLVFNIFLTPGIPIYTIGPLKITMEGIRSAVLLGSRLVLLVMGTSVMTLTTTPNALTDGIETLFMPLSRIGVPVHEMALMMSIALRFIPILMEETDKIMKAQMARGADFESGSFFRRVKSMIPLLVPLFVSAFRRAGDLALAMEARCYQGGEGRTRMNPLSYSAADRIAGLVSFACLLLIIAIRFML